MAAGKVSGYIHCTSLIKQSPRRKSSSAIVMRIGEEPLTSKRRCRWLTSRPMIAKHGDAERGTEGSFVSINSRRSQRGITLTYEDVDEVNKVIIARLRQRGRVRRWLWWWVKFDWPLRLSLSSIYTNSGRALFVLVSLVIPLVDSGKRSTEITCVTCRGAL
jgi:hypothetical protein